MATKAKKTSSNPSPKKKASKKKSSAKKTAKKTSAQKKAPAKKTSAKKTANKTEMHSSKVHRASSSQLNINAEERWRLIALKAYHKAEARGFTPGKEAEDWFEAEKEVDALLQSK